MPNDYPEIRNLWKGEWEQARVSYAKGQVKVSKWLIGLSIGFGLFAIFWAAKVVYDTYQLGEDSWFVPLIAGLAAFMMMSAIVFSGLKTLRHPTKDFTQESASFATFWWYSRLEEPIVMKAAHEILSRVEADDNPTGEELSAIYRISAGASMNLFTELLWDSPTHKIIGLRAMKLSEAWATWLPVKSILDASPATNGDSVSSSITDLDPA